MFKFGRTLGFAHAIVLGVRPRPAVNSRRRHSGKAKLGLLNSSKGASREKAVNLFPSVESRLTRVKDDGRAEALLLAHYGRLSGCRRPIDSGAPLGVACVAGDSAPVHPRRTGSWKKANTAIGRSKDWFQDAPAEDAITGQSRG
jgi:hypothetical protein